MRDGLQRLAFVASHGYATKDVYTHPDYSSDTNTYVHADTDSHSNLGARIRRPCVR